MKLRLVLLFLTLASVAGLAVASAGCGGNDDVLTIYAGRSQTLVQPLLEQFARDTGIHIAVRYGDGTELALGILEEGKNSPADIYYTQDVGALGALKAANLLAPLSEDTLDKVPVAFRSEDNLWIGVSGRSRVMVYNTDKINPANLPKSALDYIQPEWKNRVGYVPRSDGFPEYVTAMRLTLGEDQTRRWLEGLKANGAKPYANNLIAIQAVANGEIDVAYLNHYYLYRFLAEQGPGFKARNYFFDNGDLGGLFLVSGAAILKSSDKKDEAEEFINYLLSPTAQKYFADNTFEYPLVEGIPPAGELPPVTSLSTPKIDLSDLTDLIGSLDLMRQTGVLP